MVGDRLDIIHRQLIGQLGRIVAAHAINDTALLPVPPDEMDDGGDLLFLVKPSAYREGDVRAVELSGNVPSISPVACIPDGSHVPNAIRNVPRR